MRVLARTRRRSGSVIVGERKLAAETRTYIRGARKSITRFLTSVNEFPQNKVQDLELLLQIYRFRISTSVRPTPLEWISETRLARMEENRRIEGRLREIGSNASYNHSVKKVIFIRLKGDFVWVISADCSSCCWEITYRARRRSVLTSFERSERE